MIGFKLTLLPYTIFKLQSYGGILSIDMNQQSYKSQFTLFFFYKKLFYKKAKLNIFRNLRKSLENCEAPI